MVVEIRREADADYLLRWPGGAIEDGPFIEQFYANNSALPYVIYLFNDMTVDLFDRQKPVYENGHFAYPLFGRSPISGMEWPVPFTNELNGAIRRMAGETFKSLLLTLNRVGADLDFLSIRLGMLGDRMVVNQLIDLRLSVQCDGGKNTIELSADTLGTAAILDRAATCVNCK